MNRKNISHFHWESSLVQFVKTVELSSVDFKLERWRRQSSWILSYRLNWPKDSTVTIEGKLWKRYHSLSQTRLPQGSLCTYGTASEVCWRTTYRDLMTSQSRYTSNTVRVRKVFEWILLATLLKHTRNAKKTFVFQCDCLLQFISARQLYQTVL